MLSALLLMMMWAQQPKVIVVTPAMVNTASEPFDVPAVQVTTEEEYGNFYWCNSSSNGAVTSMACDPHAKHNVTRTTCQDKRRVLLTAENGDRHCLLLGQAAK